MSKYAQKTTDLCMIDVWLKATIHGVNSINTTNYTDYV